MNNQCGIVRFGLFRHGFDIVQDFRLNIFRFIVALVVIAVEAGVELIVAVLALIALLIIAVVVVVVGVEAAVL